MNSILHIVKLARIGGDWTTLAEVKEWKYVSAITEDAGEITEFEFSGDRADAMTFSRFKAQDVAAAAKGTKWYGVPEAVLVAKTEEPDGVGEPDEDDESNRMDPSGAGYALELPKRKPSKACGSAHFCKVYIKGRRAVILSNPLTSDRTIRGIFEGRTVEIHLRKGVRVEALATSCDGELVPVALACRCTPTMANAVEHSNSWGGR